MNDLLIEVGRVVKVRNDLKIGGVYYNKEHTDFEVFTEDMVQTLGKEYMILAIEDSGVILNWLGTIYTYEMLEH